MYMLVSSCCVSMWKLIKLSIHAIVLSFWLGYTVLCRSLDNDCQCLISTELTNEKRVLYDHVILLFSDWSIPNLNGQAYCQATCKVQYLYNIVIASHVGS